MGGNTIACLKGLDTHVLQSMCPSCNVHTKFATGARKADQIQMAIDCY